MALSLREELRLFDFGQVRENDQQSVGNGSPAHCRRAGPHRRVVPSACTVSTKTLWPLPGPAQNDLVDGRAGDRARAPREDRLAEASGFDSAGSVARLLQAGQVV